MSRALDKSFADVVDLIQSARHKAYKAVNTALVELYWQVGEYVSRRVEADNWGKGTVKQLSAHIRQQLPGARGFSSQNLWRMKQFHETYRGNEKLSTLLRELPWSHNMAILSKCVREEEREFYLEALDRDVRKEHEKPSVGVLLCKSKDSEVVEYALSRSLSPAVVAQYQTQLPDKALLQQKLHDFYEIERSKERDVRE